jgi:hypothetical protein
VFTETFTCRRRSCFWIWLGPSPGGPRPRPGALLLLAPRVHHRAAHAQLLGRRAHPVLGRIRQRLGPLRRRVSLPHAPSYHRTIVRYRCRASCRRGPGPGHGRARARVLHHCLVRIYWRLLQLARRIDRIGHAGARACGLWRLGAVGRLAPGFRPRAGSLLRRPLDDLVAPIQRPSLRSLLLVRLRHPLVQRALGHPVPAPRLHHPARSRCLQHRRPLLRIVSSQPSIAALCHRFEPASPGGPGGLPVSAFSRPPGGGQCSTTTPGHIVGPADRELSWSARPRPTWNAPEFRVPHSDHHSHYEGRSSHLISMNVSCGDAQSRVRIRIFRIDPERIVVIYSGSAAGKHGRGLLE